MQKGVHWVNTEQFWAGDFGDAYTDRMVGHKMIESNMSFFANALVKAKGIKTILELGCNRGLNLAALEYLDPSTTKTGVDINAKSLHCLVSMFQDLGLDQPFIHCNSILNFEPIERYDLVFTKGVLIHQNPDHLKMIYDKMYALSNKYLLIAEYFNPTPVEVKYRGHDGKLFKRDFAGEMLDQLPLKLVSYGFTYSRDEMPQDNLNWFLMEKI